MKAYYYGYELGDLYIPCQILEGLNNGVSAKLGAREERADSPKEVFLGFEKGPYVGIGRPLYNFTGSYETAYNAFVARVWLLLSKETWQGKERIRRQK